MFQVANQVQIYNFESYSQPNIHDYNRFYSCEPSTNIQFWKLFTTRWTWWHNYNSLRTKYKYTILKAIHNYVRRISSKLSVANQVQIYNFESYSQRYLASYCHFRSCEPSTNIQFWKLFTTGTVREYRCRLLRTKYKYTILKAIHNLEDLRSCSYMLRTKYKYTILKAIHNSDFFE